MAFWNGKQGNGKTRPANPSSRGAMTAAAAKIDLQDATSWQQMFRLGDHRWQFESWRHYDICGEMRFVANWIGNALSRCRMYAATVNDVGEIGDEVDNPEVKLIAETMFGSPASKAQAQKMMGVNLFVAGELYVIAEGYQHADGDKWYVVSASEVIRKGEIISVRRPLVHGGGQYELNPAKDLLIRVWNPHPRRYDAADSTIRSVLPVLREMEQVGKRIFAELDSRLAGAGILFLPDNIDFPRGDDDPPGLDGFLQIIQRTMATSLQQRDSAAAVVPILAQVPADVIGKVQHLMFDSKINEQLIPLRKEAVQRLATSLDIPGEVLTGMGNSSHWNAWQVEEDTIRIHIEPVLIQLADALNIGYFQPALKAANVQNADKMTLWFDTSALTVRPNRSDQAFQAKTAGIISDDAARNYADFTDDDAPTDEEKVYRIVETLLANQPNYAADPEVQKILGLPPIQIPAPPTPPGMDQGTLLPGDPGYDTAGEPADAGNRPLPQLPTIAEAEAGDGPPSQQASGRLRDYAIGWRATNTALVYACDSAVRRALELAGGRMVGGPNRDRYAGVPRHELHTRVLADASRVPALLAGAWTHVAEQATDLGVETGPLLALLTGYTTELLTRGHPHSLDLLRTTLRNGKVIA